MGCCAILGIIWAVYGTLVCVTVCAEVGSCHVVHVTMKKIPDCVAIASHEYHDLSFLSVMSYYVYSAYITHTQLSLSLSLSLSPPPSPGAEEAQCQGGCEVL